MAAIGHQGSNRFTSGGVLVKNTYGGAGASVAADMFFGPSAPAAISGSLSVTDVVDTASLSGSVVPVSTGTLAATEAQDTATLAGSVVIGGSFTATDIQDTTAVSGGVAITGLMSCVDQPDTDTITGDIDISGTLIAVDTQDAAEIAGTVEALPINGTLDATEPADLVTIAGTAGAEQAPSQNGSIPGWKPKLKPTWGSMAAVESPDGCRITGKVGVAAGMAAIEAQDGASAIVAIEPYRKFRQRKDEQAIVAWLMAA